LAVRPGDILRDKFRIDAVIGRGGMGQVFSATDLADRTQVAVKVVSRLLVDDVLMVRLHREAEAASRIQSDFVPRVIEVSDTEEGETFLVMERLIGESLSQRIRDAGALPWSEVWRVGSDILQGLIDAHAAGVVHRDLKPSNVFLAQKDGRVRAMVLDFGVCKMDGVDAERLTGTGESIGTVAYMAPEQIRGAARVDERADLYAFGVLVFELLTGRLPHEGPSQMAILASKLENTAPRLRDCSRVAMPEGVDELVTRALQRDPARRFGSAAEVLEAWRTLSAGAATIPPANPEPVRPSRAPSDADDPPTEVSRPPSGFFAGADGLGEKDALAAGRSPATVEPPVASRRESSAPEPHPTQTSLTTHHTSIHRKGGGARLALILSAGSLVVGVVAASVSFTRGAPPTARNTASSSTSEAPSDSAAPEPKAVAFEIASSAAAEPPPLEISDDPAPEGSADLPRARVGTPKKPHRRSAPPKSSGPRITSQPRY
jgi:serine/threonine protein kinase